MPRTVGEAGGGRAARRRGGSRRREKPGSLWRELPMIVVIALVLSLGIKTFAVQAFYIPSASMEHTANIGDRVVVNKFSPWFGAKPQRGQIVVFRDTLGWLDSKPKSDPPPVLKQLEEAAVWIGLMPSDNDQDLIKRVIGVGGDTVACCDAEGRVTVNGVALDEPYLYPGNAPSQQTFSVHVPEGRLWVMGDHRADSADSRAHMDQPYGGTISEHDVVGRAFAVLWPLDRIHALSVPGTFGNKALAVATLPSAPVVMGMVGAVPLVLRRRRVRSRRWTLDPWRAVPTRWRARWQPPQDGPRAGRLP